MSVSEHSCSEAVKAALLALVKGKETRKRWQSATLGCLHTAAALVEPLPFREETASDRITLECYHLLAPASSVVAGARGDGSSSAGARMQHLPATATAASATRLPLLSWGGGEGGRGEKVPSVAPNSARACNAPNAKHCPT